MHVSLATCLPSAAYDEAIDLAAHTPPPHTHICRGLEASIGSGVRSCVAPCIMHDVQTCRLEGLFGGAQHRFNGQSYRAIVHRRSLIQSVPAVRCAYHTQGCLGKGLARRLAVLQWLPLRQSPASGQPRPRTSQKDKLRGRGVPVAWRARRGGGLGAGAGSTDPDKVLAVAEKIRLMIIFIIP